jgi:hypothetical protein
VRGPVGHVRLSGRAPFDGTGTMFEDQKPFSRMALKLGIAGFVGFGALATGMFVTRKGRHLVREAFEGRERTRIEDRILDLWWDDPRLARRKIDVHEIDPGHVELTGTVYSVGERRRVVALTKTVAGVNIIDDHLEVVQKAKHARHPRTTAMLQAVNPGRRSRRKRPRPRADSTTPPEGGESATAEAANREADEPAH